MDQVFEFTIRGNEGVFIFPETHRAIDEELDAILDEWGNGSLSSNAYISKLRSLTKRHPDFIDGHAYLGDALLEERKLESSLAAYLQGFQLCKNAIPSEFRGTITSEFLSNRPFLRAAKGVVLGQLQLGDRLEAVDLMEKLLNWNPDDSLGMRFIIGSEYLRLTRPIEAALFFEREADFYPPYQYELGLLKFNEGDLVAAATSLRRGFAANGYIAEILTGNRDPLPLAIWHGSNLSEPEIADRYVRHCGGLWYDSGDAISFLRWLHMHPRVMLERAFFLETAEALLWEHDTIRRKALVDQQQARISAIDDCMSRDIVILRTDRMGEKVEPWTYPRSRFGSG